MNTNWNAKMPAIEKVFSDFPNAEDMIDAKWEIWGLICNEDNSPDRAGRFTDQLMKFHPIMAEFRHQLAEDRWEERNDRLPAIRNRRTLRRIAGDTAVDEIKYRTKEAKKRYEVADRDAFFTRGISGKELVAMRKKAHAAKSGVHWTPNPV